MGVTDKKPGGNLTKGRLMAKLFETFTDTEIHDLRVHGFEDLEFIKDYRALMTGLRKTIKAGLKDK
jgi:hypothetical protein